MTKNMARHNQQQLDTSPSLSAQGADVITSAQWPSPQWPSPQWPSPQWTSPQWDTPPGSRVPGQGGNEGKLWNYSVGMNELLTTAACYAQNLGAAMYNLPVK